MLRWLELLAVSVFVLEATGSPFLVALLTFLRMAPMLLCGIPAGALADRYDRRRLLIIGLVVLALISAVLALLARSGRLAIWQIALGTLLSGVFWSAEFPVRRTMLGEIAGAAAPEPRDGAGIGDQQRHPDGRPGARRRADGDDGPAGVYLVERAALRDLRAADRCGSPTTAASAGRRPPRSARCCARAGGSPARAA